MRLFITLVPHGYEIEMWDEEDLPQEVVQFLSQNAEHQECRSYGDNIDPKEEGFKLVEHVRKLDQK